nr:phospholipase [Bacillus sp. SA1-12]
MNDVDACCFKHDRCLSRGSSICQCDQEFLNCLRSKINNRTEKGRKAAIMYEYMKFQRLFTCGFSRRS